MKILCVLYDNPKKGMPKKYPLSKLPVIKKYPDGQTLPTPKGRDFKPGTLLGCVSGELGLRKFLQKNGHKLVVTSDKDGKGCRADKELKDADIVISQPFWPYYLTREKMESAPNLKYAITAGIGSDHVDLQAAMDHNIDVYEVTYCNSRSVAEHIVMMIISLVRDYHNQHAIVNRGGWNIADAVHRSYDVEGMHIGTVAAGRIGLDALRKMKPFGVHLHYFDKHRLPKSVEKELNLKFHSSVESLVKVCDVVTINCPLHPETENLFDKKMISKMKKGAYIVNTARGKICNKQAIAAALKSGQLSGYAGDVWFPQPAPNDHIWRKMPHHGMTPHTSGTSLSAQTRYADGVREILECIFSRKQVRKEYTIVRNGELAGTGKHSYTKGNATGGSKEAARYKKR
ncbi:MAG: NAD-dependent formate dehydrogenase [Proteobacteria bacterium]|jgi:formate dehydrogenase|nr:NAD-dependent formate dehydrogenase [Alphaproteobacteria bacterium]NBU53945.1 NAD-dependent formate dehydrogenase [Candidatus Fonsibacter sp. PEL3]NBV92969.1 NAD-dependent formate dehydrogenase [Candidatus Fonsibacter sp. PEL4]